MKIQRTNKAKVFLHGILLLILPTLSACHKTGYEQQSLAGDWRVVLSDAAGERPIRLPGTTDEAGYGTPNTLEPSVAKPQILHLTRKHDFLGEARYTRRVTIPADWKNKPVELSFERALWKTSLLVDGREVPGFCESLVAPHRFCLTGLLTPGEHELTVCVDNRKRHAISNGMAHAYSNETQIIWNGLLGEMTMRAVQAVSMDSVQVYPDVENKRLCVKGKVAYTGRKTQRGELTGIVRLGGNVVAETKHLLSCAGGQTAFDFTVPMGEDIRVWNEQTPVLYDLELRLHTKSGDDVSKVRFGMRDLRSTGNRFLLNGKPIFLRGTLECCIFPLTGRPPMDEKGWLGVFTSAREWGLNHLRFHSWCPPDAAFRVADSLGFYLQVELPLWPDQVGEDEAKNRFLYDEADRILAEYGNHPSFCFLSLGNELPEDFGYLAGLLRHVKAQDSRHLYTTTSFSFAGGHGNWPEADDDYLVAQWTRKGWVRGQGVFNSEPPAFNRDYAASVEGMPAPLVTHEIGQYAVYPNLKEIPKYTGVLDPLNFKGVRRELEKKGLLDKADDYLKASGRLAYILYKEEVERAMKTDGCSGIQLLDLHDFPGQGTALVGLLDAFWDSKGVAEASEFREFCAPVVPLAYFPKAVYTDDEVFSAEIKVANYSDKVLQAQALTWTLTDASGREVGRGTLRADRIDVSGGNVVGTVQAPLRVDKAAKLSFRVSLDGTPYTNSWPIWVYPKKVEPAFGNVLMTTDWDEAYKALRDGRDVLLNPSVKSCRGIEGKFVPVFWSPVHFPNQAGTMGLLLDPAHPAFSHFPTSYHTDWQWWTLTTQSRVWNLDSIYRSVTPLVECVDNFVNNRRLSVLAETRCERGRLMLCSMNLQDYAKYPEKKQLLYSLLQYMRSDAFRPARMASFADLRSQLEVSQ